MKAVLNAPQPTELERLNAELQAAEEKAIDSLARYKFVMFGYWAGVWIHVNRISGQKRPNPFCDLVRQARAKRVARRTPRELSTSAQVSQTTTHLGRNPDSTLFTAIEVHDKELLNLMEDFITNEWCDGLTDVDKARMLDQLVDLLDRRHVAS